MIKCLCIITLLSILFQSCKSQNVKIEVFNSKKEEFDNVNLFFLRGKDSIFIAPFELNTFKVKSSIKNKVVINYNSSFYEVQGIDNKTKKIIIDYKPKAESDCYVFNKIYSDATATYRLEEIKKCSDITNIYICNSLDKNIENPEIVIKSK